MPYLPRDDHLPLSLCPGRKEGWEGALRARAGSGTKAWRYSNSEGGVGLGRKPQAGQVLNTRGEGPAPHTHDHWLRTAGSQEMDSVCFLWAWEHQSSGVPSCQRAWHHLPCLPTELSNKCLNQVPGSRGRPGHSGLDLTCPLPKPGRTRTLNPCSQISLDQRRKTHSGQVLRLWTKTHQQSSPSAEVPLL